MRIKSAILFTAVLLLPHTAQAQVDYWWGPTLRVTPFVAVSPSFDQDGDARIVTSTGAVVLRDVETHFNSGFGMGLSAEWRFWKALTIIGSGMWSSRGDSHVLDLADSSTYAINGSDFWLVKAGLGVQLREDDMSMRLYQPYAHLYVAPALLHDDPDGGLNGTAEAATHPALNMGATAELPIWEDRISLVATVEDYLVFWDSDKAQARTVDALEIAYPGSVVTVDTDRTNIWFFRFGVGFRF